VRLLFYGNKIRANRNRTITLNDNDFSYFNDRIVLTSDFEGDFFWDGDFCDPPYNLTKNFNGNVFNARSEKSYDEYLESWFPLVCKKLKPNGSLYLCGDWKCTSSLQHIMEKYLCVLNRITWQREKGRGAKSNWKNSMEDIWFGVADCNDYYFDVDAVKLKRNYCGIEMNKEYCFLAEKRLEMANEDNSIQGYSDGVFWERNSGK